MNWGPDWLFVGIQPRLICLGGAVHRSERPLACQQSSAKFGAARRTQIFKRDTDTHPDGKKSLKYTTIAQSSVKPTQSVLFSSGYKGLEA